MDLHDDTSDNYVLTLGGAIDEIVDTLDDLIEIIIRFDRGVCTVQTWTLGGGVSDTLEMDNRPDSAQPETQALERLP